MLKIRRAAEATATLKGRRRNRRKEDEKVNLSGEEENGENKQEKL